MIAIQPRPGSFSDLWIAYCELHKLPFKLVDSYSSDIISQLKDVKAFMWHFTQNNHADMLFAKALIKSVEQMGIICFPSYNDCWHFDDKIAQKYLLDSLGVRFAPVELIYEKKKAIRAADTYSYPVVAKLSTGAGSQHVKLLKNSTEFRRYTQTAFHRGFRAYNAWPNFWERVRKWKAGLVGIKEPLKGLIRLINPPMYGKLLPVEKGYVYLQQFIPNNPSDYRVVVIGEKAFAIKRMVRKGDFRASGSGEIVYHKSFFSDELIQEAFRLSAKLSSTCMAYDFVLDEQNKPTLIELSYGFALQGYEQCPGFWDKTLSWHDGKFNPYFWTIEETIQKIRNSNG